VDDNNSYLKLNKSVIRKIKGSNLAADVLVGEADNHAILWRVVLVLVLYNKATTSIVVGLSFTTPAELDLEPLEVCLILYHFNKTLK